MVNINELRIGNWVKYAGTITPLQIDAYSFARVVDLLEDYDPIEITDELLEKIAERKFVMGDTATHWKIGDLLFREGDDELCNGLHWLQNYIFFRTGDELEVVW